MMTISERMLLEEGHRIEVKGKFLQAGDQPFLVKGVTYGTFAPTDEGEQFPPASVVEQDFALMAARGFNTVRTYTVPPNYLLDLALTYDLRLMVGLPWEQHLTFLDSKKQRLDIAQRVQKGVERCAQHPAILCYAIGNEIPAPIVRWYGKQKIEAFLKTLYGVVKQADPHALVTYVNYPTTEYLELDFLDFCCFNVYLETPDKLSAYIARLHNLAGDKPLVLAEIGLDSLRNGTEKQAEVLRWQIETIFGRGCAGMFVFAWTDEWWRGGFEIEDWDFGLVTRQREPKPALLAVEEAMHHLPCRLNHWPMISVAICTYNGSATIRDTLNGLQKLAYPHFEVLVINDGSTDNVGEIVKTYADVRMITTTNRGLSSARNTAAQYATGEIIAFLDDDAYPTPYWLHYLAYAYGTSSHAGMGGPNIAPAEDGAVAHCVANAPGGPVHVLTSDEIAEHIPGCNMSFRREVYLQVGGCNPVFRSAGDDVDLCWKVQKAGYTIGYHPAALVWHHRRNSLKAYWKQQKGYGRAEALLEQQWPHKYNGFGHLAWAGRIYGNGWTMPLKAKQNRVFHGTWGSALFQSVYQSATCRIGCLTLMPEWYLVMGLLSVAAVGAVWWTPLRWASVPLLASLVLIVLQAVISARRNSALPRRYQTPRHYLLVILLHLVQPVARLYGRLQFGLTPWRKRGAGLARKYLATWRNQLFLHWSEKWHAAETYLEALEKNLLSQQLVARRGGDYDRWDLQTGNPLYASVRCLLTVEEHGAGKQYVKVRSSVRYPLFSLLVLALLLMLCLGACWQQQWVIGALFGALALLLMGRCLVEKASVLQSVEKAVSRLPRQEVVPLVVVNRETIDEAEPALPDWHQGARVLPFDRAIAVHADDEQPLTLNQLHRK